jgi:hypothetical protein
MLRRARPTSDSFDDIVAYNTTGGLAAGSVGR